MSLFYVEGKSILWELEMQVTATQWFNGYYFKRTEENGLELKETSFHQGLAVLKTQKPLQSLQISKQGIDGDLATEKEGSLR